MKPTSVKHSRPFPSIDHCIRPIVSAVLFLLAVQPVLASEKPVGIPFVQAVQTALTQNPRARAARSSLEAAREQITQTRAALLPSVSLSGSRTHNRTNWKPDGTTTSDPASLGFSLSQVIFNRQTLIAYEQSEPYVAAYAAELESTVQGVFMEVANVVVSLLQAREVASLAANNLMVTRRQLEATRARYRVGEITRTDVSQAEARLASARADQVSADNAVAVARAQFQEVVGRTTPDGLNLPAFRIDPKKRELDRWFQDAKNRPDLRAARYRLQVTEMNIDLQKAGHWPTLSLTSTATRNWNERTTGRDDPVDRYTLGVSLSLPLYAGGGTVSKTDQARAQRDSEKALLDRLQLQALREVEEAYLNYRSAHAITNALESAVKAAKAALDGVEREFQVGARTALDLLDAQNELFSVRTERAKSHFSVLLAQFQLLKAAGRLNLGALKVDDGRAPKVVKN